MKQAIAILAFIGGFIAAGCTIAPTQDPASVIQGACAADEVVRPFVTEVMAIPGTVKPDEALAITAARGIIDPICTNPTVPPSQNTITALTTSVSQIQAIVLAIKARKGK